MAGGNYGGMSTPTTPIAGNTLYAGRSTTYKNYKCTAYVGNANNLTFTYDGQTVIATTSYIESIINPNGLTSDPTVAVTFFCYKCNCNGPMSGSTDEESMYNYTGTTAQFRPVIIGSNGLNS